LAGPQQRTTNISAVMTVACAAGAVRSRWNSAVAKTRPPNVPPKRSAPRLNVEAKSGFRTMATVMGSQ
jgi:hypothetical protein